MVAAERNHVDNEDGVMLSALLQRMVAQLAKRPARENRRRWLMYRKHAEAKARIENVVAWRQRLE